LVRFFDCGASASAALLFCIFSGVASAQQLPAVSAPNGKIEFDAGVLSQPSPSFLGRVAGTITVPVGQQFGIQFDAAAAISPGFTSSAALHAFTRDPASYLIGGTLGVVRTPGATIVAAGPEAEGYFDRWTLEAWGGVAIAHPTGVAPARVAPFAMADLAYYLTDDARLSVGVSSLDGYNALQLGGEYLFEDFDAPVSLTAETRIGQDGAWRITGGLRIYFGPEHKSLIRRHREDDPSDRSTALAIAANGRTTTGAAPPASASPGGPGAGGAPPAETETPPVDNNPPIDTQTPPVDPCDQPAAPPECQPGTTL
jgi:hypothetical protein